MSSDLCNVCGHVFAGRGGPPGDDCVCPQIETRARSFAVMALDDLARARRRYAEGHDPAGQDPDEEQAAFQRALASLYDAAGRAIASSAPPSLAEALRAHEEACRAVWAWERPGNSVAALDAPDPRPRAEATRAALLAAMQPPAPASDRPARSPHARPNATDGCAVCGESPNPREPFCRWAGGPSGLHRYTAPAAPAELDLEAIEADLRTAKGPPPGRAWMGLRAVARILDTHVPALLAAVQAGSAPPCAECATIQTADPLRHFAGCSRRKPLPDDHPRAKERAAEAQPDRTALLREADAAVRAELRCTSYDLTTADGITQAMRDVMGGDGERPAHRALAALLLAEAS